MALNPEQELAVQAMVLHCQAIGGDPFIVLKGPAGTGKTFCMAEVKDRLRKRIIFTAPTNKAVKVLRDALTTEDYKPLCKTIYSLLGLKMEPNGEVKELKEPDDDVDLSDYSVVVLDEGSMVGKKLRPFIERAAVAHPRIRWIIMGDAWQWPPVGEPLSWVWDLPNQVELTQVMRQDNTILQLAGQVRQLILTPYKALILTATPDVHPLTARDFTEAVEDASASLLCGDSKVIAWRNITVDKFNALVRKRLFADPDIYPWQPGDRITMQGPIKDLLKMHPETGEFPIVAMTDEEGVVERADRAEHPLYPEFSCWRVLFRSDFNTSATLWILPKGQQGKFDQRVARLAAEAREDGRRWKQFWEFKDGFHPVRHAYAITGHRAQGSTYTNAYVNWRDILLNQDRSEAYRGFYVGLTRPRKELFLG